jgi:hypothetical protein
MEEYKRELVVCYAHMALRFKIAPSPITTQSNGEEDKRRWPELFRYGGWPERRRTGTIFTLFKRFLHQKAPLLLLYSNPDLKFSKTVHKRSRSTIKHSKKTNTQEKVSTSSWNLCWIYSYHRCTGPILCRTNSFSHNSSFSASSL